MSLWEYIMKIWSIIQKKIRSLGQSIFTYFTEQERQLEREKPCISRSWLMIVKGLKAFKIKTLGAVVNKTDEWDRYARKLLKEGMSNSFFKMIHSWLWMKSFEMVVTIQPFMFANYIFWFLYTRCMGIYFKT